MSDARCRGDGIRPSALPSVPARVLLLALSLLIWGPEVQGQNRSNGPTAPGAGRKIRISAGVAHPLAGPYEYWSGGPSLAVAFPAPRSLGKRFGFEVQHMRFAFDRRAYLDENAGWLEVSPDTADVSGPARTLTTLGVVWSRTLAGRGRAEIMGVWGGSVDLISGPTIRVEGLDRTEYSGLFSLALRAGLGFGVDVARGGAILLETALHQGVWLSGTLASARIVVVLPVGGDGN